MNKEIYTSKILMETISEMIIIFTAAAIGAIIGSGKVITLFQGILATAFVFGAIILRKFSK